MTLLGVDVSHWQGDIDWTRARSAGVAFGIAKASESTSFVDSRFRANIAGMRAAGIIPGAYHFLRPGDVTRQADLFCSLAPGDVIHALDVEASGLDVAGWVARYRTRYPVKTLLVYTGRDLWARAGGGDGSRFGPLWVAGYVPNAYVPGSGSLNTLLGRVGDHRGGVPFGGWASPSFLQFTAAASVPGVPGPCDGDVFYGGRAELEALAMTTMIEDPDMQWTDKIKLTATDCKYWNLGVPAGETPYVEGDEVTIGAMLRYPTLARKLDRDIAAFVKASIIRDTTILNAVEGLASGSPEAIQLAFVTGVAQLTAELTALRFGILE